MGSMKVDEFLALPESDSRVLELRNGELVELSSPKKRHSQAVVHLNRMLFPFADNSGWLQQEF